MAQQSEAEEKDAVAAWVMQLPGGHFVPRLALLLQVAEAWMWHHSELDQKRAT